MHRFTVALLFSVSACAGNAVTLSGPAPYQPSMVEIEPGLYVVADQEEPVFFASNFYWRFHDDGWYRTTGETGDWIRIGRPPAVVLQLRDPERYRNFRPQSTDAVVIRDQHGRWHRR